MNKGPVFLFFCLLFSGNVAAQLFSPEEEHYIDSLEKVIENPESHDTSVCKSLVKLSEILYISNFDTLIPLSLASRKISEKNLRKPKLNRKEWRSFQHSYADASNNLAYAYTNKGDIRQAMGHYRSALKAFQSLHDLPGTATVYNNIAELYSSQGDLEKTVEYLEKGLRIRRKTKNDRDIANSLNNLGEAYSQNKEYGKAEKYHRESLAIRQRIGDEQGISSSLHNLGVIYYNRKKYDAAMDYFSKSLAIAEKNEDLEGVCFTRLLIGEVRLATGQLKEAEKSVLASLELARELGFPEVISNCCRTLARIYQLQGNYPQAYRMLQEHQLMKDSILNDINKKAAMKLSLQFEFEKKAVADSLKTAKEKEITRMQLRGEKNTRYFLFGILFIILVFAVFIFNRYRVTHRQKEIITQQEKETQFQKHLVEEKNKEITDSITYAKRIQSAILPPEKLIRQHLPENFILYLPKDIVAGDFYWFENGEDLVFFAAADCTGHGVPGAMVSVVCHNALNRSVKEFKLKEPAKILDKTREIVISEFEKSDEDVKDGMDISLCTYRPSDKTLFWAGAHNPLWILRKGELLEFRADKQPIGKYTDALPFTGHEIPLQQGDCLYIFTDGLQDQFGGEKGKKFKASQIREILLGGQHLSMPEQKNRLEQAFYNWKSTLEQVDDVCFIGVKI